MEPAKGRGEEPRFRAARRHPGSFDGLTVRAVGRKAGLGTRGRSMPLRAIGRHVVRQGCPPPIPSRPLVPRARSLVESGRPVKRELDSQPGNRCFAARSAFDGRRQRSTRWRAGQRAATGCARPSRWLQKPTRSFRFAGRCSAAEGAPGREMPAPFMRSGGKRLARERQRKAGSHSESEQHAASRANLGDPKRVKRHERDTRRASVKTRSSVDHVKLGCSFFEKWVVRLKFGRIS